MSAATLVKACQKKEYLGKFIRNDVRPDYRKLGETRPITLNLDTITTADGSAMVKLGETLVFCGVTTEVTKPIAGVNDCGRITCSVELTALSSAKFAPKGRFGVSSDKALVLSKFVEDILIGSTMIDLTQLNISSGKHCWTLNVEAICYNCDGNLKDAVLLAVVGALTNVKIPTAVYDEDNEILTVDTKNRFTLQLSAIPIPLTFTVFDQTILLVDPTEEEETVSDGSITLVMTGKNELCKLMKYGGPSLTSEQLNLCIAKANERWNILSEQIVMESHK